VAVGDTFEAMVVVYFLRRYHFEKVFTALRDGLVFLIASAYGAAVAAIIGPVCLILGRVIHPGHFKVEALTWWQGDFMGLLVFGPTILVVLEPKSYDIAKGKFIELGMLLAITFAASMGIFASRGAGPGSLPFLLFPLLVWAAIRFTQLGVVCCATLITCVAIWATAGGLGPFARIPLAEGLFVLQAYACVLMASSMVMATAITERLATELTLIDQAKELGRMDEELKEANRRVTNILEGILQDGTVRRRGNDD
jgi:integral membrane sensor domain MASE1